MLGMVKTRYLQGDMLAVLAVLAALAMLRVLKLHMNQQGLQQAGCVRAKDRCRKVGMFKQKRRFLLSVEAKESSNKTRCGRTYICKTSTWCLPSNLKAIR